MRRFVALVSVVGMLLGATAVAGLPRAHAALGAPYTGAYFSVEAQGVGLGPGGTIQFTSVVPQAWGTNGYYFDLNGDEAGAIWVTPPTGSMLAVGAYENVTRSATAGHGGFDLAHGGVGCNTSTGRFVVDEISVDGGGALVSFSARFEHHCEGGDTATFGQISYNATADYRVRTIAPHLVDFGSRRVQTTTTQTITVTNFGPSPSNITSVTEAGTDASAFAITADACSGQTIAASSSCTVVVAYAPTTTGDHDAKVVVVDEVAATGEEVLLHGNALPLGHPSILMNTTPITFAAQRVGTYDRARTLYVKNAGDATMHVNSIAFTGTDRYDFFGTSTCPATLAPQQGCRLRLYFSPARRGDRHVTLAVRTDGGNRNVALAGTGTIGYYLVRAGGQVSAFGDAVDHGSIAGRPPGPVVGMATTPNGEGYWLAGRDGSVYAGGNAAWKGSLRGQRLAQPIVGMASTPDGKGYWTVARDGGIFAFGNAKFRGSTGAMRLNQPIVGMASTVSGKGYWLVASDGGIFAFGDARFFGSTGAMRLNQPIVGMAPTPSGKGYWLVASDGGVFAFGDARFYGSTGAIRLTSPIVGMEPAPDGRGYWFVARDGGLFSFGPGVAYYGSLGGRGLNDVAAMAGTSPPLTWLFTNASSGKSMTKHDVAGRVVREGSIGSIAPAWDARSTT